MVDAHIARKDRASTSPRLQDEFTAYYQGPDLVGVRLLVAKMRELRSHAMAEFRVTGDESERQLFGITTTI